MDRLLVSIFLVLLLLILFNLLLEVRILSEPRMVPLNPLDPMKYHLVQMEDQLKKRDNSYLGQHHPMIVFWWEGNHHSKGREVNE